MQGGVASFISLIGSGKMEEVDNTDEILADAINEFYFKVFNTLDKYIDVEEWSKYLEQAELCLPSPYQPTRLVDLYCPVIMSLI